MGKVRTQGRCNDCAFLGYYTNSGTKLELHHIMLFNKHKRGLFEKYYHEKKYNTNNFKQHKPVCTKGLWDEKTFQNYENTKNIQNFIIMAMENTRYPEWLDQDAKEKCFFYPYGNGLTFTGANNLQQSEVLSYNFQQERELTINQQKKNRNVSFAVAILASLLTGLAVFLANRCSQNSMTIEKVSSPVMIEGLITTTNRVTITNQVLITNELESELRQSQ